jgi:lysophospholipase L1-like esterase
VDTSRQRIWAVRIVLVGLTLLLTFAGLEFLLDSYYAEGHSQAWTTFHAVRGWAMVPGDYWFKPLRELHRISVHINDMGLRGPSTARRVAANRHVVILGDSFVLSMESEYSEAFPQRLENLLNSRTAGGVEVVNAGVPGYGTAQELLLVRELYERLQSKPDVFLLMFFTNDILDNLCLSYGDLKFQPVRPCFTLDRAGMPVLTRRPENQPAYEDDALVAAQTVYAGLKTFSVAKAWLEEWMQTRGELVELLSRMELSPKVPRLPGLLNGWYRDPVVQHGAPLTTALIAQMNKEIRGRGGELIVSMIPSPFQIYPETYVPLLQNSFPDDIAVEQFRRDIFRPQRLVREMCVKAGVPFQDLAPILAEHRDMPLFIPRDGHLTHMGHKVASEALLPFVLEHMPKDVSTTAHSHLSGYR